MVMNEYREWKAFALIAGMAILFSSCAVHRHSRPHRHHHHRHKVVVIAEQATATGQNKDCRTLEACLAMTEPDSYGNTE